MLMLREIGTNLGSLIKQPGHWFTSNRLCTMQSLQKQVSQMTHWVPDVSSPSQSLQPTNGFRALNCYRAYSLSISVLGSVKDTIRSGCKV